MVKMVENGGASMSNTIRYASVCSGVEAASLAWEKLDWKPVWSPRSNRSRPQCLRRGFRVFRILAT